MEKISINLNYLLSHKDTILKLADKYGFINIVLFGSIVRGEETPDSDIDIVVSFDDKKKMKLGYFARLLCFKDDLSEFFKKEVDVSEK
ncbi:MAG: nucleotidyltransferase family protein, partial [bacterium]